MFIDKILKSSKNIAIVGLSPDENKASNKVAKYLQECGYNIYPIYPKFDKILDREVYRNLSAIKDEIDIVVMFRKGEFAEILIEEVIAKKVKTFWLQLGIKNEIAKQKALQNGINFIEDKCIMIEHLRLKKEVDG